MRNTDRNSSETDSPKTPGGISKSLLTPIRRLGLSRKWKNSSTSPFVSPLANNIVTIAENDREKKKSRKRKLCVNDEVVDVQLSPAIDAVEHNNSEIITTPQTATKDNADVTPIRRVSMTRKKPKTLISSSNNEDTREASSAEKPSNVDKQIPGNLNDISENWQMEETVQEAKKTFNDVTKNKSPSKIILQDSKGNIKSEHLSITKDLDSSLKQTNKQSDKVVKHEQTGPNKLTKECIVVIQNKIYKVEKKVENEDTAVCNTKGNINQTVSDSDSDDVPLSCMNVKENQIKNDSVILDDNFTPKVQELKNKTSSTSSRKSFTSNKSKSNKTKQNKEIILARKKIEVATLNPSSQSSNSFDDDDDDDFELNKRTILVRKSYDKVVKPSKAKSTGSISQKDIDELKARIEMKKKILLAKASTQDTVELRGLIKKWQKGCQDALMELLELMKKKLPDHSNMDYSNILQMLKIPPALVGYDQENDCFNTPDDNNVLAATFNDL